MYRLRSDWETKMLVAMVCYNDGVIPPKEFAQRCSHIFQNDAMNNPNDPITNVLFKMGSQIAARYNPDPGVTEHDLFAMGDAGLKKLVLETKEQITRARSRK